LRLRNAAFTLPLMRLLDRYLLRELLVALVVCFCAFTLLWIAADLMAELHKFQEYHLRAVDIIEYYVFTGVYDFIPIGLPVALLLALLYALTNHARYNEITAMRAAGISLVRLCLPYFIVGFLASAGLFALDEYYAPKAANAAEQVLNRRVERQLTAEGLNFNDSAADGSARTWQADIYNTKTSEMLNPKVSWLPTNGGPRLWLITKGTALWTNRAWHFFGKIEKDIETNRTLVPVLKSTNTVIVPELTETPKEIQSEINIMRYRKTSLNSRTRTTNIPLTDIIDYLRLHPHPERKIRSWLYTKLHGRFAEPFTCLVVVFVAVPFAAGSGRRNVFVGVAASIGIFFTYFVLQQVGLAFGETGWVWPWFGAWFPNLFFTVTGLIMMARVR
jgi:lipopolysaccharide export system permease protein